jgi:hypothetical protein
MLAVPQLGRKIHSGIVTVVGPPDQYAQQDTGAMRNPLDTRGEVDAGGP